LFFKIPVVLLCTALLAKLFILWLSSPREVIMSVIFKRCSVRNFLPDPVESDKIERILKAGMQAPSAHNRQPWEFIVITNGEDLKAVAEMSPYAKMLNYAPAAIAACANTRQEDGSELDDTQWVQDMAAATENILLQIVEEGLGGVWLGWYPIKERTEPFMKRFALPAHVIPFSVIALGYPGRKYEVTSRFDAARIHYGAYGRQKG
jgi:nitroreductase